MEVEDITHISEEKELMGERVEKLKEEWDSNSMKKTRLDWSHNDTETGGEWER